jgi:hypothetical protein
MNDRYSQKGVRHFCKMYSLIQPLDTTRNLDTCPGYCSNLLTNMIATICTSCQQANRMNTNRFLPRWHYVENYINAMVGEENDNENDGTPQDDTREVRQQEHLPPMSPALTNTEPNINNLQIHELMKMQSNIRQMSNTCEPNETRLLNEHPLTKHLIEQDLHTIVEKCCTIPITQQVVWTPRLQKCNVTAFQLSRLIKNGELICNEIIISYYEMICSLNLGIFYIDTTFLNLIITEEWGMGLSCSQISW